MFVNMLEVYKYREMLKNLVIRDLRTRYKESVLGFLWTLLNPILMLIIYTIAFKTIMRMDMPNYSVFLFSGLLPWTFLQTVVSTNTSIIVNNSGLVKKIYFPHEILPLSATLAGAINYLLCLIALFIAMLYFHIDFTLSLIYFPLILLIEIIFIQGLSLLFSSINVYFRDVSHIVSILFMAWFYLTPIFYPLSMVPEKYRHLYELNPMTKMEQSYQAIFYYGQAPEIKGILISCAYALASFLLGSFVFNKLKKKYAEEL
ncbi:ABC transporter permease [Cohnella thailandensis]|uniref:Transport permease protein n=1 Tax=Cohnella thailandensis TaxID=557557 RepID=A0A841T8F6_9BACL|nr:ABC transporter permease [Cohnella thailandensis]MBB6638137.1 ABC transporter permease [Cohnella thailandensis]MBP1971936.1 ABC-2 type transport system permease protein [Cohnella thailandensis]